MIYTIEHPMRGVLVEKYFDMLTPKYRFQWSKRRTEGQHFASEELAKKMLESMPASLRQRCYLIEWQSSSGRLRLVREHLA
jgi:hypothetical protein